MKPTWILILLLAAALLLAVSMPQAGANKENSVNAPVYTADGSLKLPANYREWVYLSSGLDMSYSPNAMNMDHSMFDNVFANPGVQGVPRERHVAGQDHAGAGGAQGRDQSVDQ